MTIPAFDVAIQGAGPVGATLALLLARHSADPSRILLLASPRSSADTSASHAGNQPDPRTLALNHGSRTLLEPLGAWPAAAADIHTVHVSQKGRLGRTLIHAAELATPRLGSVVTYPDLQASLDRALAASGILIKNGPPARIESQDGDGVTLRQGDDSYRAALAVRADGLPEDHAPRTLPQHAILTLVRANLPRLGWAWERFTRSGPLALLPHPAGPAVHAVVWCMPPDAATSTAALDDDAFSAALTQQFGDRLGRLSSLGSRTVFPLSASRATHMCNGRSVVIGNAAQTLHPVAGQGLNLGLRDAARLALALSGWQRRQLGDPLPALQEYDQARQRDRTVTSQITQLLPWVFATGAAPVEHAAGAGLLALDLLPSLRNSLARHLLQGIRT